MYHKPHPNIQQQLSTQNYPIFFLLLEAVAVVRLLVFDRLGPFLFSMVAWRTFFCFLWRLGGLFVVLAAGSVDDHLLLAGHV